MVLNNMEPSFSVILILTLFIDFITFIKINSNNEKSGLRLDFTIFLQSLSSISLKKVLQKQPLLIYPPKCMVEVNRDNIHR